MIEYNYPQLSDEWFAIRLGHLTGSRFPELMPTEKARSVWTQGQSSLLIEIASQILTGEAEQIYQSFAMTWGVDHEREARAALSDYLMTPIRESGFWEYSKWAGSSPDGIAGDNGIAVEIKCPLSKTHMSYYLDSEILWGKYRWQTVGHSLCTGIDRAILCSFDPRFPPEKQLVVYDPGDLSEDREKLRLRIDAAVEIIEGWL